jgi:hypothetical protein
MLPSMDKGGRWRAGIDMDQAQSSWGGAFRLQSSIAEAAPMEYAAKASLDGHKQTSGSVRS